jgi:hypothetical protein
VSLRSGRVPVWPLRCSYLCRAGFTQVKGFIERIRKRAVDKRREMAEERAQRGEIEEVGSDSTGTFHHVRAPKPSNTSETLLVVQDRLHTESHTSASTSFEYAVTDKRGQAILPPRIPLTRLRHHFGSAGV